ncbi:MAG TPA: aminoacyl-tRNA hydrolase [Phycisphaerae bacterium]|nr:aminoacyl-tRNA hydrolase [Phycisphaerae bacterium]
MIHIDRSISVPLTELELSFVHSSGPGGQNVNKVATACQLRFDVAKSPSLPEAVKQRLIRLAGRRVTGDGVLLIDARRFRTQHRNRQDAIDRLTKLLQRAARPPKPRKKTRPTLASREKRLEKKRRRAQTKQLRKQPGPE